VQQCSRINDTRWARTAAVRIGRGLEILGPGPHTATKSHLRWQEGPMASDRNRVPVAEAFAAVPRAPFLPATERTLTECNVPVAIGQGQTNSQPSTVADMLELLVVRLGDRALDLGAGSGWTTGLLGLPGAGPVERILATAGAEEMPDLLLDQLEIGGIMVIPVQGQMLKVIRDGRGSDEVTITRHGLYRFVPLITE